MHDLQTVEKKNNIYINRHCQITLKHGFRVNWFIPVAVNVVSKAKQHNIFYRELIDLSQLP